MRKEGKLPTAARLFAVGALALGAHTAENSATFANNQNSIITPEEYSEWFTKDMEFAYESMWKEGDFPTALSIPSISFLSNEIQPANKIDEENTFEVPDYGIATPKNPIENNVYIYGHSRQGGIMQKFSMIAMLEKGEIVAVRNQRERDYVFEVSDFVLRDTIGHAEELEPKSTTTLTLQTSVKNGGKLIYRSEYLEKIAEKTGKTIQEIESSPENLVLIIVAKLKS